MFANSKNFVGFFIINIAQRVWRLVCGLSNICYSLVYILIGLSIDDNDIHNKVSPK